MLYSRPLYRYILWTLLLHKMIYRWFSIAFLGILLSSLFNASVLAAPQDPYFAYLLAPKTEITINDEIVKNPETEAQIVFQGTEKEEVVVSSDQVGQRIISNTFSVDIRKDAQLTISHIFQLDAGSIHVRSKEDNTYPSEIMIGELKLSFTSAEFLAFVSGDSTETVIKVIEGEVEVVSPSTQQNAILKTLQGTSTDQEGRLLIPFPIGVSSNGAWWNAFAYQHDVPILPIADAGDDQQALNNMLVVLDGSRSEFHTGDIFEWKLVSAPNGINGKPIEKVSFNTLNIVKPVFTPKVSGEYLFSLQITDPDGKTSNTSMVNVLIGKQYLTPTALFPDVSENHPNNLAITYLYKKNVMRGSSDPETGELLFRPEDTINRVEILKTIFENFNEDIPKQEDLNEELFLDVKAEHWFAPYVQLAKDKGIIKGNDGLYRPADEVLLVEAVKIIVEASEISIDAYKNELTKPYIDVEKGAWYNPYLFFIKKYNLFDVDEKGNIQPAKAVTRAEFAEIIYRLESSNLQEKRGFISGRVLNAKSKTTVTDAEIFIYKTVGEIEEESFLEKGELFEKVLVNSVGSFTVSVPIHHKFYLEAVTENDVSINKVIIQVQEDEVETVELLMEDK
jgi:hypothetical protein